MSQLDLFYSPELKNEYSDEELVQCRCCKEFKPRTDFYEYAYTKHSGAFKDCKRCYTDNVLQVYYLKKVHKYPHKNPVCACCGALSYGEPLHLDHDHVTGLFRGYLCRSCNTGIGALGDSIEGLEKALTYMKAHYERS